MLEKITDILRRAGEIILSAQEIASRTQEKSSAADLVTEYDVAVENFLKKELLALLPEAVFYGEEETENQDPTVGWAFIVDPIDGTTNFVRGIDHSAVSVGLAKDGVMELGAVYDPYRNEMFTAARGQGAHLNGRPIHVSGKSLDKGIFIIGTSIYLREFVPPTIHLTHQLLDRSCDMRRFGAASLDLCAIACGRAEVFAEYSLSPWDYAAGALIVHEAGGKVTTFTEGALSLTQRSSVWATNTVNHAILHELEI